MNIFKTLVQLANKFDQEGLFDEARILDEIIKDSILPKTRFDEVDISSRSVPEAIQRYRENMAKTLQELVSEGELDFNMQLIEVIQVLFGKAISKAEETE